MTLNFKLCILWLMIIMCNMAYGQHKKIDSLEHILKYQKKADTNTVKVFNSLAVCYDCVDQNKAKIYFDRALLLSRKLKYPLGEAETYTQLSYHYINNNADPQALEFLNHAFNIYKSLHSKARCAYILTVTGSYYSTIKDYGTAMKYDYKALGMVKGLNNITMEIACLGDIGDDYEQSKQFEKAYDCYKRVLLLAAKTSNNTSLRYSYLNIASINLKRKKYEASLYYCARLREIYKTNGNPDGVEITELNLLEAQNYLGLKNYVNARKNIWKSDSITRKNNTLDQRLRVYQIKYLIDSATRHLDSALKDYSIYHQLSVIANNLNKNQLASYYNFKTQLDKKADENFHLNIVNEKNRLIIAKQRTLEIILGLGLFLFLFILVYLKKSLSYIKTKNRIINEQNKSLENGNMVRNKLFSIISHDLRSPVAQVVGLIDLWEKGDIKSKEISALTPVIKDNITNTLQLLDNMLIWSNKQLQGSGLNLSQFKLYDLVAQNINDMNQHITQKNLLITNSVNVELSLCADYEMLRIVFRNLISNAVKFTPFGGRINISSCLRDGQIVTIFEDTGIGISETNKQKLFEFGTHNTLGTSNEKGAGIGLKICNEFMELHKGKIWFESEEGVGSKFYVSFRAIENQFELTL